MNDLDVDEPRLVTYADSTYAIPPTCPHKGAPLARAEIVDGFLRCPWHGAVFDVTSGALIRGPECEALAVVRCDAAAGRSDPGGSPCPS